MTEKEYGLEYLAQTFQKSTSDFLKRFGGYNVVEHRLNKEKMSHSIKYKLFGCTVDVDFYTDKKENYFMQIGINGLNDKKMPIDLYQKIELDVRRSRTGRVSLKWSGDLAEKVFKMLKDNYVSDK